MEAKNWAKWILIFTVLTGFTGYVFFPYEAVPYVSAYSWDEAVQKIDWQNVQNNTIMLYTQETDFVAKSYGGTGWFAIWQPAQENFDAFIRRYCFTYERLNMHGKVVHVFKEVKLCSGGGARWDSLSPEVKAAYKNLRPKELRGTMTRGGLAITSAIVS